MQSYSGKAKGYCTESRCIMYYIPYDQKNNQICFWQILNYLYSHTRKQILINKTNITGVFQENAISVFCFRLSRLIQYAFCFLVTIYEIYLVSLPNVFQNVKKITSHSLKWFYSLIKKEEQC